MLESPELSEALRRWFDTLLEYKFNIVHRPGILNVLPDALSRMYGTLYKDVPTWGVSKPADLTTVLNEFKVSDSSMNEPPTGKISAINLCPIHVDPLLTALLLVLLLLLINYNDHPVCVRASRIPGAGLGLFANKAFKGPKEGKLSRGKPGEFITLFDGKLLVKGIDFNDGDPIDTTYMVEVIKDTIYLDGATISKDVKGLARYANRPPVDQPQLVNARFSVNTDTLEVSLVATKNIKPGDEIYVSYGRHLKHDIQINAIRVGTLTSGAPMDVLTEIFSVAPEGVMLIQPTCIALELT